MTWFAVVVLKGTALLAAVWLLAAMLRNRSAGMRHLLWCAGLVGVLALPALSVTLPWRVPVETALLAAPAAGTAVDAAVGTPLQPRPSAAEPSRAAQATGTPSTVPSGASVPTGHHFAFPPLATLLFWAWIAGAALVLLRLAIGMIVVRRRVARGTPLEAPEWTHPLLEGADRLGLARAPRLVMSDATAMPFAAGIVTPTIVVPADADAWSDRRRRAVLTHELAHLRRADLAVNTLGQIACALYWFHPLVWVAAKRLRMESERACDNLVLGVGTRPSEYADHLLEIVCGAAHARTPALALPMAERREFEGRMLAILERDAKRNSPSRMHTGVLAGLAALLVIPLASLVPTARPAARPPVESPPAHEALRSDSSRDSTTHARTNTHESTHAATQTDTATTTRTRSDAGMMPRTAESSAQTTDTSRTRVVAALLHALDDSVTDVRRGAAYALGELDVPAAVPGLARALTHDPSDTVREMSAWALGEIGDKGAVEALGSAVSTDASASVRITSVWALGQIGDPSAVGPLTKVLRDASPDARSRAAWALGQIGASPAPSALIAALKDADAHVRMTAAWALGQIDDTASAPALAAAIHDGDPDVRRAVLWAIGQMDTGATQDVLVGLLNDPDPKVRSQAAAALGGHSSGPWPWPWPWPRN